MLESRLEPGVWTVEPQLVGGDSPDLRASWSRRVDARSRSWLVVAVRGWVWPVCPPVGQELSRVGAELLGAAACGVVVYPLSERCHL